MKKVIIFLLFALSASIINSETVISDHVRYREYPFLNMNIIGMKNTDDEIKVLARSDFKEKIYEDEYYWYFILSDNQYGWMYGEFIDGLKDADDYRVYYFNSSMDMNIYDYDFEKKEMINLRDDSVVHESEVMTEYSIGENITCWFNSIELRDSEGYGGNTDLIIKSKSGEKILLFGDDISKCYCECAFIKLSPNERYLMVDQGTSHSRGLYIYDTTTGVVVLRGSYRGKLEYDGSRYVIFYKRTHRITGDKEAAIQYITENSVKDLNGYGIEDDELKERIEKAPDYSSYSFGYLYEFDTQTGQSEKKNFILYYIDIQ